MSYFKSSDVTVVIPTTGRASLRRAVESVLNQTEAAGEVVVVADALFAVDEILGHLANHVRILHTKIGEGGNAARQLGIRESSLPYVALLDDDDSWIDIKLETFVVTMNENSYSGPWIFTSQLNMIGESGRRIWPIHAIQENTSPGDYVIKWLRIRRGTGFMQSSTLIFPKSLALLCPFDELLRVHQDLDWLVRVGREIPDIQVIQYMKPLVNFFTQGPSLSKTTRYRESVDWACNQLLPDKRLFGDFILTGTGSLAMSRGDIGVMLRLVMIAEASGKPGWAARLYVLGRLSKWSVISLYSALGRVRRIIPIRDSK